VGPNIRLGSSEWVAEEGGHIRARGKRKLGVFFLKNEGDVEGHFGE
jgi:hypothetical protein